MGVKSRVITEIDNLFSEYNEEKDSLSLIPNMRERRNAIEGAISALKFLKGQVQSFNPAGFEVIHIVERSESELPRIRNPKGYLSRVLFSIKHTRERRRLDGRVGSGHDPDAVRGRNEACDRMREFICQLNDELIGNQ